MKRNNKKGFTIVELVIVIAVIAILSAVLIPTFGSVISDANKTAAQQEARNAYTSYIQANKTNAGALDADLVVKVDGYYFEVEAGQLKDSTLTADPSTGYHSKTASHGGATIWIEGTCVTEAGKTCGTCGHSVPAANGGNGQ